MKLTKEQKERAIYIVLRVLVGLVGLGILVWGDTDRYDGVLNTTEACGMLLIGLSLVGHYIVALAYAILRK
jgi:hypothetical protein